MPRSTNKQLFINISTNAMSYILSLGITFFLTPYIVRKLGIGAYGFIGLSTNIINYTSLLTVALNSMSGRFISLHYHRGEYSKANAYLASVFYSNLILSVIIFLTLGVLTFFLDVILDIPPELVADVKLLFILLVINAIVGLMTSIFSISTFVKNRIEKSNIVSMSASLLRCVTLILLFVLFKPELWFFGLTAVLMSLYICYFNLHFYRVMTPELKLSLRYYDIKCVVELIKSGVWNLISSLSLLLNEGFDLLLANLFISPVAMGMLSVSKTIPNLVTSFIVSIVGAFNPEYVKLYAEERREELKETLLKSIRLLGFISAVPLAIIFAYGDIFFHEWLPDEDSDMLYAISCTSAFLLIFALPFQSIWYVFTLENKLKRTSLNALANSAITFAIVIIGMYICQNDIQRLFVLAGARSIMSSFRCLTFLPLYASNVLGFHRLTFYWPIIANVIMVMMLTSVSLAFKYLFLGYSWCNFFLGCFLTGIVGLGLGAFIVLTANDRKYIWQMIDLRLKKIALIKD